MYIGVEHLILSYQIYILYKEPQMLEVFPFGYR